MNAQRLAKIEKDIETIKARIAELGILRPGSLTRQYKDPKERKGAYYQVSYTHRMRSRTAYVRADAVAEVRRQIRDHKKLKWLVERWVALGIEYSGLCMKSGSR